MSDYPDQASAAPHSSAEPVSFSVDEQHSVSGLFQCPKRAHACFVLAHGAGAGMRHLFLEAVALELAEREVATFRYQFPFIEQGSKRPDPPRLAQATVRAAVAEASRLAPRVPLIAGGRSFGGRMTSQAQAGSPLPNVRGLAFLGFPLHPAGRPSSERGQHLLEIRVPMLFLQGTRDALAELHHLEPLIERLGRRATVRFLQDADHSFHVPARSGRTDAQVRDEIVDALATWIGQQTCPPTGPV